MLKTIIVLSALVLVPMNADAKLPKGMCQANAKAKLAPCKPPYNPWGDKESCMQIVDKQAQDACYDRNEAKDEANTEYYKKHKDSGFTGNKKRKK